MAANDPCGTQNLQRSSKKFEYCIKEGSARSLEIQLLNSSLSEIVVVSSLISKRYNSQQELESFESKPQYTVINLNDNVSQRSMIEIQEIKFRDDESTFYSYSGFRTNSFKKKDDIIFQAEIDLENDGLLIWSDMVSDSIYQKLANFTSLVIFCYAVFTIVVRPIAKHSFVLRVAKKLYTVNQEITDDKTPILLKPAKGQKHQSNRQNGNGNKKR